MFLDHGPHLKRPQVSAILYLDAKKEVEWWICILKQGDDLQIHMDCPPVNLDLCASLKAKTLSAQGEGRS